MRSRIVKIILVVLLLAGLVFLAFLGFTVGYDYVYTQNNRFQEMQNKLEASEDHVLIPENAEGAIEVYVPHSATISDIAKILTDKGLISNQALFKILSKFNGFDGNYQSGTHQLMPDMSYDEIMFVLTRPPKALSISFPEGLTYQAVKKKIIEAGLNIDEKRLDELVQRPNVFLEDYDFVRQLPLKENREWFLQGYLWPDTYQFDPNMDEEGILRMFLDNTERKLAESEYLERAAKQGMSLDDVIVLASIVQAESNVSEMSRIAKVFLNRLKVGMPLESDATINYLREQRGEDHVMWVSHQDQERFRGNPYDTYSQQGLPPGPINNPGTIAIEAVLWPASEYSWEGADSYLYFCATGDGNSDFSKTLEEHNEKVLRYSSQTPEE